MRLKLTRTLRSKGTIQLYVLVLLIAVVTAGLVFGEANSPLVPYTKVVLENGLTVIVKEVHSAPITAVDTWVAVGAKHETTANAGISHFLEHMLFKGTKKRKVGEIAREIQAVGGYQNASTSHDATHYYVVVPSAEIGLALDIEADALMNSTFEAEEIERERKVILEEKRLKEDDPQVKLGRTAYREAYAGTPYSREVIGTEESISAINRENLLDFYRKYYIPNNMAVVVVGDVNTGWVIKRLKKLFGSFRSGPVSPPPDCRLEALKEVKRVEIEREIEQSYIYLAFPGPALSPKDSVALTILGTILGDGRSCRLYQELREEKKLVHNVVAGYSELKDVGMFVVFLQTRDTKAPVLEQAVLAIMKSVLEKGVTEEELLRAKALLRSDIAFALESDADIASILGEYQLLGNITDAVEFETVVMATTKEDVQRVAQSYLNFNGYVLAVAKPVGGEPK